MEPQLVTHKNIERNNHNDRYTNLYKCFLGSIFPASFQLSWNLLKLQRFMQDTQRHLTLAALLILYHIVGHWNTLEGNNRANQFFQPENGNKGLILFVVSVWVWVYFWWYLSWNLTFFKTSTFLSGVAVRNCFILLIHVMQQKLEYYFVIEITFLFDYMCICVFFFGVWFVFILCEIQKTEKQRDNNVRKTPHTLIFYHTVMITG